MVKVAGSKRISGYGIARLADEPAVIFPDSSEGFGGYEHFTDSTKMGFSNLTYPSVNCTVPSFDKIIPDLGKTLKGQEYTENVGINGNKQKFKNLGGIEMEVREFSSTDTDLKDVIEVGFFNNRLVFSTLVGAFTIGETISGQVSGAGGRIEAIVGTVLFLSQVTGVFQVGEPILGNTSGATAVTVRVPIYLFHQITENVNPLPRGVHEYYFDEWFDTNLNPALSKNLPRVIWVNGYENPVLTGSPPTRKGEVYSWTGGVAIVTSIMVNTSISTNPLTTWRSLGFSENAAGNVFVVVNGIPHQVTTPADIDTSTIRITNTAGISIGDIATSQIETDITPIPFDHCRQNKGYMFYGNWKQRDYYQSNGFNRPDKITVTSFAGTQNDLILRDTSHYTGTTESVFHVTIDSVAPNDQTFQGNGTGAGFYITSGYSASSTHTYKFVFVADMTFAFTGASDYDEGTYIIGATANDVAIVVWGFPGGAAVRHISGTFNEGDAVTGTVAGTSGVADTIAVGGAIQEPWWFFYKDGVLAFQAPGVPTPLIGPSVIALGDGLSIEFDSLSGIVIYDAYTLNIGQADTFSWQKDDGPQTSNVAITGGYQTLSDGVRIKFINKRGHSLGDTWDITALPAVTRAWDNFYYALPVRRPGEGYKYRLPSNFWTHDTQEESMYINGSYGEWSVVDTILSSDLQSETVSLAPLKQAGANKVLYPYLTGHLNDKLVYINTEHSLDTLGREELLEKPQTGYLSDPVKLDFIASSFIQGRIKYFGKRLYISSPQDGITHCYDTYKKYWQAPKTFIEVGILSIIENDLVCHSNIRNQTFTMFTNTNGDNGQAYTVEMRSPSAAPSGRWKSTFSNQSFLEGYIDGQPPLIHTAYLGVKGCSGIKPHPVEPIVCTASGNAPFGEGAFGSHSFGSDIGIEGSYFNEIYKAYAPVLQYYFISLGIKCTTKTHTYQILSMGMNGMNSPTGNNTLVNPTNLAKNNP